MKTRRRWLATVTPAVVTLTVVTLTVVTLTVAVAAPTPELARVQNLVRANVLDLAQEILETKAPALTAPPSDEWMQWRRQLWALYRVRGQWQNLIAHTRQPPPASPDDFVREAQLLHIAALTASQQTGEARNLIRRQLADGAPQAHQRQLRQALVASYLADELLLEARIAMNHFRRDYGDGGTDWTVLSAGVLLRTDDAAAAVNLLAPLDQPSARLLRLYARLQDRSLTPKQVGARATELLKLPAAATMRRDIHAVVAAAAVNTDDPAAVAEALENYLLAPPPTTGGGVYPKFTAGDLLNAYSNIARAEANRAGLLVGDEAGWLAHAEQLPAASAARKAMFADLAATAVGPALRRRAVDAFVDALIDAGRTALLAHLFGDGARLGRLILGGETGVRLSAHALSIGDYALAADANANLAALPAGVDRNDWLLQAGRVDIFAGNHRQGADKLVEWLSAFKKLNPAQADAILQPIFDLQTVAQHERALMLLTQVNAKAPAGKYAREIAYWIAESHHGLKNYTAAADWFLQSALQQDDGFDRWGEAARFRAAETLMDGGLLNDARRLFEDLLARAQSDARKNALQQKLQQLWLLESASSP